MMNHLQNLGNRISIPITPDEDGFTGRECPAPACEGYFKIECGTGLKGTDLPCHCPYCGHTALHDQFWTQAQLAFAKSYALRKITDAFRKDLKSLEFENKPKGGFGIGFSFKIKPGAPTPVHHYREKELETEVICMNCTLRYSVYGVFAYCPDCGEHNSAQILDSNFALVNKMLDLAATIAPDVGEKLTENALEDCISAFDGFGREVAKVHASLATDPQKAMKLSFQNLEAAQKSLLALFGLDIATGLSREEWQTVLRGFQKRHVVAHKMGVVDEEYIRKTDDHSIPAGRKINTTPEEVRTLLELLRRAARRVIAGFSARQAPSSGDDAL